MMTPEDIRQILRRKARNLNGYVFAVALLTVGMAAITHFWLWFILGGIALWVLGVTTALWIGANTLVVAKHDETKGP